MSPLRKVLRAALTALASTAALAAPAAAANASSTTGQTLAHVWVTTPDGHYRLTHLTSVPFIANPFSPQFYPPSPALPNTGLPNPTPPTPTYALQPVPTIIVDPTRTFQKMAGFGAAITDSSASVLYQLPAPERRLVMRSLFRPKLGDGLSYLRQPLGGSDFVATKAYTFDDVPAGETDFALAHFSIAHDEAQIIPLLRMAEQMNPKLGIVATPWSPPAWMKSGGSLVGGRLLDDPRIYEAYARYLTRSIEAYEADGVHINAITVQNEPQNRTPLAYPGTDMPSWQEAKVIEQLGPMLKAAELDTSILGYDHNWSEHPNDIASSPPDEQADSGDYPQQLLNTPAAQWISGVAFHCYYGDPSAMSELHRAYPDKDVYFTECSGVQSDIAANTFSDGLKWHSRNLIIGSTRNWAKTIINWNIALDQNNGPHVGGCATCTGVVTVDTSNDTVSYNSEYYTLGHIARFVQPGAVRIASTSFGTTQWNGQIIDVAFRNPDGSTVLIVHNENDNPQQFAVVENGQSFDYKLPGGALATFVWKTDPGTPSNLSQVDPAGMSAQGNPPAPSDSCCQGDVAGNAVDDDASTRWSTGAAQEPGDQLTVDLGRLQPLRQVTYDTGGNLGDFPRSYDLGVSADGQSWKTVVANGSGDGTEFTNIPLDGTPIRYVRMTLTGQTGNWWSVADFRAYVSAPTASRAAPRGPRARDARHSPRR